jgi:hypothetical protein
VQQTPFLPGQGSHGPRPGIGINLNPVPDRTRPASVLRVGAASDRNSSPRPGMGFAIDQKKESVLGLGHSPFSCHPRNLGAVF